MKVAFVGGHTGGHLYPGLAVAEALAEHSIESCFFGSGRQTERDILSKTAFEYREFASLARPQLRSFLPAVLSFRRLLKAEGFLALVGLGGAPEVVPGFAARAARLPIFLLEQNRVLGRAHRLLSRWATRVFLSFEDTQGPSRLQRMSLRTGCPVRASITTAPFDPEGPVLVLGGSQGSEAVNQLLADALPYLSEVDSPPAFVHLVGRGRVEAMKKVYKRYAIEGEVLEYVDDMAPLLARSSLVISRAGGSTVAELQAVGRPSILIPYPHHKDRQQYLNAEYLEQRHACLVHVGDASSLAAELVQLWRDPDHRRVMAGHAHQANRAASVIAQVVATHLDSWIQRLNTA